MIIGIDASRAQHPEPTGVEIYSDEIVQGLFDISSAHPEHDLRLYTPKSLTGFPAALQKLLPPGRLWTQRRLARELVVAPPDVLFVPSHVLPRRRPVKSVLMIHDVAFREFPSAYSFFQYAYLHWTTRVAVRHAWKVIVPSRATAEDLQRYYRCAPEKVVVIPHGFKAKGLTLSPDRVNQILAQFHLTAETPYVFFVGRLEAKKNIGRLVQAFAQFRTKHPEWKLVLGGGRGVGFPSLLRELDRDGLLENVLMPGYLTDDEKHVLFTHARQFAFVSLSEGFGFPILEAASHGVPVVASRIPALLDFENLVSIYVDPHDIESIADGLEQAAQLAPIDRGEALRHYSWPVAAQQVWDLLTSKSS